MAHNNRTFLVYISETRTFPDLNLGTWSHLNVIYQVAKKLKQSEMVRLASGTTLNWKEFIAANIALQWNFLHLPWMEKLRAPVFYTPIFDINVDINFYRQQMLLLNSLYFLRSHCY